MSCDIPAFPGFYEHSKLVAGSSLLAAELVAQGRHDVVLNWMGGLHHARKSKASGFCYVNDCVLAIVRLLHTFQRVLYIDARPSYTVADSEEFQIVVEVVCWGTKSKTH